MASGGERIPRSDRQKCGGAARSRASGKSLNEEKGDISLYLSLENEITRYRLN
jgi:hypothetical protein